MTSMLNCPWCGSALDEMEIHSFGRAEPVATHHWCETCRATFHNTGEIEKMRKDQELRTYLSAWGTT